MKDKVSVPRVLFPRSIAEALEYAVAEPEGVFWAGGTRLSREGGDGPLLAIPKTVISLGLVEELARASRSEQGLEIGAMMSLDRLASIGRSALPAGMPEALSLIGTRPLRCRATLGGHLALREGPGDRVSRCDDYRFRQRLL